MRRAVGADGAVGRSGGSVPPLACSTGVWALPRFAVEHLLLLYERAPTYVFPKEIYMSLLSSERNFFRKALRAGEAA